MEWLRRALSRLGWPVDSLSDEAIASELCSRWLASGTDPALPECTSNIAAASGVFIEMARSGNLDALCWSEENDVELLDEFTTNEVDPLKANRGTDHPEEEHSGVERRGSARIPTSDLVSFAVASLGDSSGGWLVDISSRGIAFVTENQDIPAVGARILPKIQGRDGKTTEVGSATVVRTRVLDRSIGLVCARLEEPSQARR